MIRNNKWKLISFHRKNVCELYDLENDPWEHHDLSEHPDYEEIKWELLRQSFDETVYAHPPTSPPVYPF